MRVKSASSLPKASFRHRHLPQIIMDMHKSCAYKLFFFSRLGNNTLGGRVSTIVFISAGTTFKISKKKKKKRPKSFRTFVISLPPPHSQLIINPQPFKNLQTRIVTQPRNLQIGLLSKGCRKMIERRASSDLIEILE